jgi:hypothetical protein
MLVGGGQVKVRESWCRPCGTRAFVPFYPALTCRAITFRRFAAESSSLFHRLKL